jgi:hypothetical protein
MGRHLFAALMSLRGIAGEDGGSCDDDIVIAAVPWSVD